MNTNSGNLNFDEMMLKISNLRLLPPKDRIKMIVVSKYPGDDPFIVEYEGENYLLMSKSCMMELIKMFDTSEQFLATAARKVEGKLYGTPMIEDDELCKKIVLTAIIGKAKYKQFVEETTNYSPIRVHYHEG